MNSIEELKYLTDLLINATRWVRPDEESATGLESEIQDRINRICSVEDKFYGPDTPEGTCPDKYERQRKYVEGKVRVSWMDDAGKTHRTWFDKELCTQVPVAAGCCTKMKWALKDQAELDKLKEMAEED